MRAKKHLGQHFLNSRAALTTLVETAAIDPRDTIVEVGPGTGVLTRALLATGARVCAVEADADMCRVLEETFNAEIASGQLVLVHEDIRTVQLRDIIGTVAYKVVANIPYYITGEIIRSFLTAAHQPISMTLLMQKEVAERIARSKKESVLSLSVKAYGAPRYCMHVPRRYFKPPPQVDSAILHIANISRTFFDTVSEERFFKFIKAGFASKRKKLINNLSGFGAREALMRAFDRSGLSHDARAEELSLEQWRALIGELERG